MRPLLIVGTLVIFAYIIRKATLRTVFCRDLPVTPDGWEPKFRYWVGGVEQ